MAVLESRYICDKCGKSNRYLSMVFNYEARGRTMNQLYQRRLCETCFDAFVKHFDEWCGTPEIKDPEPVPIKTSNWNWLPKYLRGITR